MQSAPSPRVQHLPFSAMAPKVMRRPAAADKVKEDVKALIFRVRTLEVEKEKEKKKREKLEEEVRAVRFRRDIDALDINDLFVRVESLDSAVDSVEVDEATGFLFKGNKGEGKDKGGEGKGKGKGKAKGGGGKGKGKGKAKDVD